MGTSNEHRILPLRPTRRAFSRTLGGAFCGGLAASIFSDCGGPSAPSETPTLPIVNGSEFHGVITVAIDAGSPLAPVGGVALLQTSLGLFLVAHTGVNAFTTLDAMCTHANCVITTYVNHVFMCPCHGATFDTNGRVVSGPAPTSLPRYPSTYTNGVLTITT